MNDFYFNDGSLKGLIALLGAFLIIFVLCAIGFLIFNVVASYKLYKKLGKEGWESLIPFYRDYVIVEVAGLNMYWLAVIFASFILSLLGLRTFSGVGAIAGVFGRFVCNYNLSKRFGKDGSFAVLMTLFPFVMNPLLAFSKKYVFDSSIPVSNNGPFNASYSSNSFNGDSEDNNYCKECGKKLEENSKFCSNCGKEI